MYWKRRALLSVVVAGGLILSACGSGGDGSAKSEATASGTATEGLTKFSLATFSGEIYALDAIAKSKGFFEKRGLDVTTVSPSAGGGAANTLLLAGSIQAWAGNPNVIFTDVTKGAKVKFSGGLQNWIPYQLQVPKDSDLAKKVNEPFTEKMKALDGKTIGVTGVGSIIYFTMQAALKISGVPDSGVKILGIGPPANAVGQLAAGRVDAYLTYSRADALIMGDTANTVPYADLSGPDAPSELQAFSSFAFPVMADYAQSNPKQVTAYIGAIEDAYNWGKANTAEAAKVVSDAVYKGEYVADVKKALTAAFAIPQPNGFKYDEKTMTDEIKLLVQLGQLPKDAETDPSLNYKDLVLPFAQVN